jgi:hypothetical protein
MATKSTQLTDPDYQARLEEAYQKLVESLDQRKNRFFDPTYLAAAQAFATPTKTGSAFEALGNVAGAVGKSQEEEFKRNIEENKARFDINKELLTIEQQRKNQAEGLAVLRGKQPPAAKPSAPEPAGALPVPPPAEGGALTSAIGAAPAPGIVQRPLEVATQGELPPFQPTKNESQPGPELVTKPYQPPPLAAPPQASPPAPLSAPTQAKVSPAQEELILGMTEEGRKIAEYAFRQGASIQDAIEKGQKFDAAVQKRQIDARNIIVQEEKLRVDQGQLAQGNIRTLQDGTVIDMSSGEPKTVYRVGGKEVNIGGETFLGDPVMIGRYYGALERNDLKESERLARLLTKNRFGSPIAPTQEPAAPTAQAPLTVAGAEFKPPPEGESVQARKSRSDREEAQRASDLKVQETVKIEKLKAEQKRQEELVSRIDAIKTQKNETKTLIDIFNKKDVQKVLGPTAKPGVKAAIGEVISGGLNVGGYQVAIANFDKAIVQVDASQEVITQLNVARSLLSKAELLNAKTYLKGEGTVTNMERAIVKDINGIVDKDPANALLFKSQLANAQANMNERYIKTFQSWRDKNPDGTIEQFNRTKAYETIESDYHNELKKINKTIGLGPMPTEKPKDEAVLTTVRSKLKDYANKAVQ